MKTKHDDGLEWLRDIRRRLAKKFNYETHGKDVFIVQGCHYPVNDNFMELLFWIDAARRASAQNVTAVIPFFSYAQGDKKDEPRVSIRARVCADAIEAAGADLVSAAPASRQGRRARPPRSG